MKNKIELTEAEAQYLRDVLLKQMKILADVLGTTNVEKYLRKIDKAHAYDIYKKLC